MRVISNALSKIVLAAVLIVGVVGMFPKEAYAAVSFVNSCESGSVNGGNVTLTLPSLQANDLIIIAYSIGDNDSVDFDMDAAASLSGAGYTEIADLHSDDTQDVDLGVYYKIADGTETSELVDGQGGTDAAVVAVCMVFRGVDTTNPFDVTSTTATGINTMHPNPPSIDHNNPSGVFTVIAGADGDTLNGNGAGTFFTFPTGYTTNAVDHATSDTSDSALGMGYNSGPSDPEDPGTMTRSGTDSTSFAWTAVTMALRPQTGSAPSVTTGYASNVGVSKALLNGVISSDGGQSITTYGFATSTSATLATGVSTSSFGSITAPTTVATTSKGHSANTTYYYRFYATNLIGTSYGDIHSFVTGNSEVTRRLRIFEGFFLKLISGTIKVFQR